MKMPSVKDLTPSSELDSLNNLIDSKYVSTKSTCSSCTRKSTESLDKVRLRYESTKVSQYNSNKLYEHTSFSQKSSLHHASRTPKPLILIQSNDGSCDKCIKSSLASSNNTSDECSNNGNNVIDTTYTFNRHAIRSNYMDRSIDAKKKVIRMLFVIVAEFFICWTPIHVLNTWYLFDPEFIYRNVGPTGISLVHLLSYISSCCNPITYCFMNRRFRQAFLNVFYYNNIRKCISMCMTNKGKKRINTTCHSIGEDEIPNNSDLSRNSTMFIDPTSHIGRSGKNEL